MPEGSIVIDELIFPIVDMRLDDGTLWVVAEVRGPIRAGDSADYAVHGRDGKPVWYSQGNVRFSWPAMRAGTRLRVSLQLDIEVTPAR